MIRPTTMFLLLAAPAAMASPADPLEMSTTPFVRGYPATISVSGAAARTPVFLGYSTAASLNPGALCPAALGGECLDLRAPQLVPATPRSDAAGDAELTFVVPGFLSDMYMQAGTGVPNAEVSNSLEIPVFDANPSATLDEHIDNITGVDMEIFLDVDVDDTAVTCTLFGACSCEAVYEGTGSAPVRNGQELRFDGTWQQDATRSDCSAVLSSFIWAAAGGAAFHTFTFNQHSTGALQWVVHSTATNGTPVSFTDFSAMASAEQLAYEINPAVPFLGYSDLGFSSVLDDVSVSAFGLTIEAVVDVNANVTLQGLP